MFVLSSLACVLNYHAPFRRDVSWNGRVYVGNCRHCGASIERYSHRVWHKRPAETDRQPGPPTPT